MSEVLDLSGAKLGQFDLLPTDWYDVIIFEITDIEKDNDEGVLAEGTKGYNVQFKVEGGELDNRRVFNRFYLPEKGQHPDEGKRMTMLGRFGDLLKAAGYSEKDLTSGKFKFDKNDATGRPLRISVGEKNGYNTVRNYKPIGENVEEAGII